METLIDVKELHKRFGDLHAVRGVTLAVNRGDVLGFLGPNGAGKSTTMKMLTGFLEPTAGEISVCGIDVLSDPINAKKQIGYLPEGAPLYGEMSTRGFLNFIADIRGLGGKIKRESVDAVIDRINLRGVVDQRVETLSKGFKRRVGLAQALLHDPQVLVLDEPTDGLDPNQKHEVRKLIDEISADKAIIISTHILEEVDALCTRATIISSGTVVFTGTPQELEARSSRHNAVRLVARAKADELSTSLNAIADVASLNDLQSTDGLSSVWVLPKEGASITAQIGAAISAQNWELVEMHVERGRLDEVFREVTSGQQQ